MTPSTSSGSPSELRVANVLVPLDGSEFALQALPTARVLAARFGADLHAVSVAGRDDRVDRLRASATAALDVDVDDDHVLVVTGDDPADAIARRAESLGSCIVCLTTHGRGRLRGAVVGSVARSVLQRTSEPIVALGPLADNPGWSPRPRSWPEPLSVGRIVACVDGSDDSEQVLPIAAGWALRLAMSMTILTVTTENRSTVGPQSRAGGRRDAQDYVDELARRWRDALSIAAGATEAPAVDGEAVSDPLGIATGVRMHLERRPAGLLAMTTSGRSGLQRARRGAVASEIVHASVVPCLVAPVEPSAPSP